MHGDELKDMQCSGTGVGLQLEPKGMKPGQWRAAKKSRPQLGRCFRRVPVMIWTRDGRVWVTV
jgi:hypothetical protein